MNVSEMAKMGGEARARKMTPEQRRKSAQIAIRERWRRYYELHPDKLAAKQNGKKKGKAA